MIFTKEIIKAQFIKRPNRFQAYVKIGEDEVMVHVPNTGRCKEILVEGCTVILRYEPGENRKTKYDLIAAYKNDKLINIDSQVPNKVIDEALKNKKIENLRSYNVIEREKTYGNSRFDFRLTDDKGKQYFLEVKGATLEESGVVMFPDAPTERGRKHIMELVDAKNNNNGAGVLFLIQMDNVKYFTPNNEKDPEFSKALKYAAEHGVEVMAYSCEVDENSITLKNKISIIL
ncbi:MAG: DNA/RNA nuclease SfsA [Inconstantimicrobium porci]|uniref:Sugar fermentation stimulation protein homolog n=1 Tax=Inconstantimicrobium porci TaxID=2652291 RepID=A0A7X2MYZ1_9CLOT|nr:DNA/RNA nuclease SfsA [Inconstantimicrobium porci]MDD6770031.1 DNA/RNA nuclease SfsA [Inconstantimicrobium porci]MDY5913505.1 DNA/RNA nuclease SfsA [Inconstantimicrobium porci]MSR91687.1 DNA/RNA nuclease SfsA [Inconstantimicrobium porci]